MRRAGGYLFLLPYLLLFAAFLVLPLIYGLVLSVYRVELLSTQRPTFIGAANYVEAIHDGYFVRAFGATLRFAILAVPLTVATALGLAVLLNGLPKRRQAVYRAAVFLPAMITITVAGILWRWFFNGEFGLFNHYLEPLGLKPPWLTDAQWAIPSIVLMTLWWTTGGPTVVLLAGLQHIPVTLLEAASLDGATPFQRFVNVTLPQLRPVLTFVLVMNLIGAFQVFGQTFMITRGGPELATRVVVQYIYETAFNNYRMGYAAAMSWLLFVAIAASTYVLFRLMRER